MYISLIMFWVSIYNAEIISGKSPDVFHVPNKGLHAVFQIAVLEMELWAV